MGVYAGKVNTDGSIIIDTRIDTKGFAAGSANIQSQFTKLGSAARKIGATIASVFAVREIVQFSKECLELGSNLQEVQNVVDVTFTTMNEQVNQFAKNAKNAAGLSETMAKQYVGTFGAMAKSFKFSESETYEMATALTQLSGDVASFYNLTQDAAYTKLKSVFTGETETLKDLGVVMTQTALDSFALEKGLGKTTSQMTEQEKVALRYQFVMEQLSGASGDFVRTSDSWANQTRLLTLQFDQLKATLGQGLINALTPALQVINEFIARLQVLADNFLAFTRELFGDAGGGGITGGFNSAADGAENLEGAITSAGKAAKKYLAPFDEIAKISNTSSGSSSVTGGLNSIESADESRLDKVAEQSSKIAESWAETAKSVKEIWYETLGETSIRNIENYNTSLTNLKSGWENLIRSLGTGGEFSIAGFLADIIDATILSMAGGNKTLGGLFDLYAELRKHYAEEGLSDNLLDPVFKDADVWDALGETISGIGMTVIPFMTEEGMYGLTKEEWENLFLPITEEYTNFFKGLSVDAAEALSDFGEEYGKLKDQLAKYRLTDAIITENDVSKVESMTKDVINTVTAINDDARKKAEQSVLDLVSQGLMSNEEAAKALADLDATYSEQEAMVKETQTEILKIVTEAKDKNRKLTAEENRDIQNLLTKMKDRSVAVISRGADDSTDIYEKLEENRGNISKQMLSETIQYANDEYEASVQAAQDNYDAAIENANRLYNDLGVIDEAEYERIKADAENKRKIQVNQAKAAKDDLIKTAKEAAGGVADAVDPETGEILSNWELIWNGMYESVRDAWEAIKTATKNALNSMIGFINTPIAGLNALSTTVGGKTILGAVMPSFSLPQIPLLAKGAVLPPNKPFMAVVGDQKHGTNIEAPLSTIEEAVANVMGDMLPAMIAGFERVIEEQQATRRAVEGIEVGDTTIGEAANRYRTKLAVIEGGI